MSADNAQKSEARAAAAADRSEQAAAKAAATALQIGASQDCHGFGLLTPLFGVSSRGVDRLNPNRRDELRVTGPIESGIGGGYYHSIMADTCNKDFIVDWEVFGFSEGLNPSTTFQIGAGAGIGFTAFGRFQFGISVGYDLIRRETMSSGGVNRTYSNGLLEWNDVTGCGTSWGGDGAARCAARNFTWLLTFGITGSSGDGAKH